MTAPVVVAIDPGGRACGVVSRQGDRLLEHAVLVRGRNDDLACWVDTVTHAVAWQYERRWEEDFREIIVACEDVRDPTPQMGTISVRGLLDTAAVIGAVLASMGTVTLITPAGNGAAPRQAYPPELWGREVKGTGVLRHCRSAWDVAGTAAAISRMHEAAAE